jgi:hygromycin-B 7''-O-kinase
MSKTHSILPYINSDNEYEKLNLDDELFKNAAREILARHNLPEAPLSLLSGTNIVFAYGNNRIIKMFPPMHQSQFMSEALVMKHLYSKLTVATPAIEYEGEITGWPYIIMNRLDGIPLEGLWEKLDQHNKVIIIRELGSLIREVHSLPTQGLEAIDCHWEKFIANQINQCVEKHKSTNLPDDLLEQIPKYLESMITYLPVFKKPVILTGEYTPMNFIVKQKSGIWHIEGLIDFGDAMLGLPEYDLLGPGAFLIQGDKELLTEFLVSYGYSHEDLTDKLSHQLTLLMLLHKYSNLNVQIRIANWKEKVSSISDLEKLVWGTQSSLTIQSDNNTDEKARKTQSVKPPSP